MTTENSTTDANVPTDPLLSTELADIKAKYAALESSHKSLQRTLENERRRGGNLVQIEKRLADSEALQLTVLESLGKLNIEGMDTKSVVEKYHQSRKQAEVADASQGAASRAIVSAFEAAGISQEAFDAAWEEPRFAKVRELYGADKLTEAVNETVSVLARPAGKSDEEVKQQIEAALAADRQTRAAAVDSGRQTAGGTGSFTQEQMSAWLKLPAAERLKDFGKAKEYMSRG